MKWNQTHTNSGPPSAAFTHQWRVICKDESGEEEVLGQGYCENPFSLGPNEALEPLRRKADDNCVNQLRCRMEAKPLSNDWEEV